MGDGAISSPFAEGAKAWDTEEHFHGSHLRDGVLYYLQLLRAGVLVLHPTDSRSTPTLWGRSSRASFLLSLVRLRIGMMAPPMTDIATARGRRVPYFRDSGTPAGDSCGGGSALQRGKRQKGPSRAPGTYPF